jgi:hypothetical protein
MGEKMDDFLQEKAARLARGKLRAQNLLLTAATPEEREAAQRLLDDSNNRIDAHRACVAVLKKLKAA